MTRILLRAGKSPFDVLTAPETIEYSPWGAFRNNSGNLMFADAVHRVLSVPGTRVVANAFLGERAGTTRDYFDRINAGFDHFAVPLANAFRPSFMDALDRLTATVRRLRIPVSVIGVGVGGGAGSLDRPVDDVPAEMRRRVRAFVDAVLDRSAAIGVRGEETRGFLRALGYGDAHVEVIGCPSLFRNGDDCAVRDRAGPLGPQARIAMNLTPYVAPMGPVSLDHAARYPGLIYVPQDIATARLMLWGGDPAAGFDPAMPVHPAHPLFAQRRMLFFCDSSTWTAHLASMDFAFGTRIHGNIAALVAGTPAVVLAHDTRTLELARYHEIPHRTMDGPIDAAALHDQADFAAFNRGHRARFDRFHRFLARNGLPTIFDPGRANPGYDAALAGLPLPGPIGVDPSPSSPRPVPGDRYRFDAAVPHQRLGALGRLRLRASEAWRTARRGLPFG